MDTVAEKLGVVGVFQCVCPQTLGLTWSDHIVIVILIGQGIANTHRCFTYITPLIRKEVMQALALTHLEYCVAEWSSAAEMHINQA